MTEHEDIIKGYDPVITRRILSYLKPYKLIVFLALFSLAAATVAQLYTPVIIQQAVDREILVRYAAFDDSGESREVLSGYLEDDAEIWSVSSNLFVSYDDLAWLTVEHSRQLQERGLMDEREWYLTERRRDDSEFEQLLADYDHLFVLSPEAAALPRGELDSLSEEELSVLRSDNIASVFTYGGYYLLLLLAVLAFSFAQVYLMAYIAQRVMADIRLDLFSHVLRQSLAFLGRTPVGTLVTRITNDVETINEFFTSAATTLLKDLAMMAGVLVVLFALNTQLAWITVASLPPVLIAMIIYRYKARDSFRRVRLWISRVNSFLSEHISGMDVVQMFAREDTSRSYFTQRNKNLLKANLSEMYVFATFRPLVNLFTSISIGVIIYFGASMILDATLSLGILIAYINLIDMFYRPVMEIADQFTVLQSAMAGGERIFSLMDDTDRIEDNGREALPEPVQGSIEFRNVTFSYKENEPVIKDMSFTVHPGESIAIVGYTGAGKTTIANLLARLWDVQEGEILLDGRDIREYRLSDLRKAIQPVQQDVFLFSGTIAENIAFGSDFSLEHIRESASAVQADQFISRLPGGYDTNLTEWGANFSTGERQLISFSRVVAHDPRVIILDEATASIDTETEVLIQEGIRRLMKGRTSIVIAHRLSTIRHADRILVLSGGRLAEIGTHEQLLEKQGLYYNLYQLQFSS